MISLVKELSIFSINLKRPNCNVCVIRFPTLTVCSVIMSPIKPVGTYIWDGKRSGRRLSAISKYKHGCITVIQTQKWFPRFLYYLEPGHECKHTSNNGRIYSQLRFIPSIARKINLMRRTGQTNLRLKAELINRKQKYFYICCI